MTFNGDINVDRKMKSLQREEFQISVAWLASHIQWERCSDPCIWNLDSVMIDVVKDNLDSLNNYLCDLYCFIFFLLVYIFFFIFNFKMFANALYCRQNCIISAPYIFVKKQHFLNYLSYFNIYISVDYFPILFFYFHWINSQTINI